LLPSNGHTRPSIYILLIRTITQYLQKNEIMMNVFELIKKKQTEKKEKGQWRYAIS
jgi:hypothetical protein